MNGLLLPLVLVLLFQTSGDITEQTQQLADQVTQLREESLGLADRFEQAEGENREILRAQIERRGDALGAVAEELATNAPDAFSRLIRQDLKHTSLTWRGSRPDVAR